MSSINKCPKCGYSSDMAFEECPKCGVIIEKFIEAQKRQEKQKRIEKLEKRLDELEKIDTPSKPRNLREKAKSFVNFIKEKLAIPPNLPKSRGKIKSFVFNYNKTLIICFLLFFVLIISTTFYSSEQKAKTVIATIEQLKNFPQDFEGKNVAITGAIIRHEIKKSHRDYYFLDVRSSGGTQILFDCGLYGDGGISLVVYENLARKMAKHFMGNNYVWRGCTIRCHMNTSKDGKSYFGVVKRITLSEGTVFEE